MRLLAIVPFLGLVYSSSVCDDVYPHLSMGLSYTTEQDCSSVGGCWDTNSICYFPKVYGYHYAESKLAKDANRLDSASLSGILTLIKPPGCLGPDYDSLKIDVTEVSESTVRIKIYPIDANGNSISTWEVPESVVPRNSAKSARTSSSSNNKLSIKFVNDPFELIVLRGKDPIFFMSKMLVFQEQYAQVVLSSSSDVVATVGFGESTRSSQFIEFDNPRTLWNTDYWAADAGANSSLYGSHPFLIQHTKSSSSHGVLLMNSNAMEMTMSKSDEKGNAIAIQTTGGLFDL